MWWSLLCSALLAPFLISRICASCTAQSAGSLRLFIRLGPVFLDLCTPVGWPTVACYVRRPLGVLPGSLEATVYSNHVRYSHARIHEATKHSPE